MIAMNGISYGTSNSGSSCAAAASTIAFGIRLWSNPVPKPSPARPVALSSST